MTLRVTLVDDEAPARRKLRRFLETISHWQVVAEADSVKDAIAMLEEVECDLVLLDIQLGDGTGFDVLSALANDRRPQVVFITAYDQHAIAAFEVHATDYLLKPIDRERFYAMAKRVDEQSRTTSNNAISDQLIAALKQTRLDLARPRRIYIEQGERGRFINESHIISLQADGNYVQVHVADSSFRQRGTLAETTASLDHQQFVQVNRSVWVNFDHIVEVQSWFRGDRMLIMSNGQQLKLKRSFASQSKLLASIL